MMKSIKLERIEREERSRKHPNKRYFPQAAGIPHSKRRFCSLQVVRRGATIANPLVQTQVQAARVDSGGSTGTALQMPQL